MSKRKFFFLPLRTCIDTKWQLIQRTISNDDDYEVVLTYHSDSSTYNHMAIDDISIINGPCRMLKNKGLKDHTFR